MNANTTLRYHTLLLTANVLFGMNYSFYSSIIGRILTSDELFFVRIAASALFFVPYMFLTGRWKIDLKDLYIFVIIAAVLIFGRIYIMLWGMNYTSPIDGSIIATMNPILIMLISAVIIREKITLRRSLGILLGAAGALTLILSNAHGGIHAGKLLGNLLIMVSILFSAFNTVFIKKFINKYDPFTVLGWVYLIGIVVVLPLFGPGMLKVDPGKWSGEMWMELGYITLFGSVIATGISYYGLKGVSATSASMYAYAQPVAATLLAVWRGQDKITAITVISAALIFIGVFVVITSYRNNRTRSGQAPAKSA